MGAFIQGIQLGIILFFLVGPVFIILLEETLTRGRKAALLLISGLWLSELMLATITHFGLHQFLVESKLHYSWGYVGAAIIITVGIVTTFSKQAINDQPMRFKQLGNLFLKGWAINTFNPFVLIFWLGVATQVDFEKDFHALYFYAGLLMTIILGDLLKIFSAHQVSKVLKPHHLVYFRKFGGILLIILGIAMIFRIISMN